MPFDHDLARTTVGLSAAAYRARDQARAGAEALGLTDFRWLTAESTQAFTASDGDRLFVAFRGTEANPIDWSRNARFNPLAGEFGSIHSGFVSGLAEVWEGVLDVIADAGKPVIFTGHSLGGALAMLGAVRADAEGHEVDAIYTYGQPRIGLGDFSRLFAERLGDRTYRSINHVDLVTRVPLLLQGYRHVGERIYFDSAGGVHIGAGAWKIIGDDLKHRLAHWGRIEDAFALPLHDMTAYEERIGALGM
ncbi:MAG TPA: lipase family protein [Acidimicrobiia bacterium]|nr:lipase family protein [Acidimicrobiia bacterium]